MEPECSDVCMFPDGQSAFNGAAAPRVGMPRGRGGRRPEPQGAQS